MNDFFKKYFNKKTLTDYAWNTLSGRLLGFFVGLWATGIVTRFVETKSVRNLWGLKASKTVVDKATYENIEWIVSAIIGFFVFEIFDKVVREKVRQHGPVYYNKFKSSVKERGLKETVKLAGQRSYDGMMKYPAVKSTVERLRRN